jgi:MFS family permease
MFSMSVGPVIGGALSEKWGFRSTFMTLAILAGLAITQIIVFLPETLRSVAGNGSVPLKGIRYSPLWSNTSSKQDYSQGTEQQTENKHKVQLRDFWEPMRMLSEMDTLLSLLFGAVVYSSWCMITGTTTMLLAEKYHLTELHIGLAYLPNGESTSRPPTQTASSHVQCHKY